MPSPAYSAYVKSLGTTPWANDSGGDTIWANFDPAKAAAAGLSPQEVALMGETAAAGGWGNTTDLGEGRTIFAGDGHVYQTPWFKSLDPQTQQSLIADFNARHPDKSFMSGFTGAFLPALSLAALPMAGAYLSGALDPAAVGSTAAGTGAATGTAAGTAAAADPYVAATTGGDVYGATTAANTAAATGAGATAAGEFAAGGPSLAGAGGSAPAAGTTTAAAGGTALSRILNGTATAADWASVLGPAFASLLGAYASNQQTNAFQALADKYAAMGAPYRTQLSNLMANPSSFLSSPEVTTSVQMGTDALARSLSTKGNPVGSGGALQQLQNYATNSLYSALQNKESQLANFGGLANYNAAVPGLDTSVVGSNANTYNAVGAGIANLTNPAPTLADLYRMYRPIISTQYGL